MLMLCLILSVTYYAKNYAGIIGWSLRQVATNTSAHIYVCLVSTTNNIINSSESNYLLLYAGLYLAIM